MDAKKLGEFVVPFADAIVKLKKAADAGEGICLGSAETGAVVEALKMLRSPSTSVGEDGSDHS
jgi:hypothetical protein